MPSSPIARVRLPDGQGGTKWYQDTRIEDFNVLDTVAGELSEFEVLLANEDGALNHITPGDEIKIEMSGDGGSTWEHIIIGRVTTPRADISTDGVFRSVEGANYGILLEDRSISDVFRNITVESLVKTIIQQEVPELTVNNVSGPGVTLDKVLFPNMTVKEALNKINDLFDEEFVWFVDKSKDFHFEPEGTTSSGEVLEYGTNIVEASIGPDESRLVNFALVYGLNQTTRVSESISFDGTEQTFQTEFKPDAVEVVNETDGRTLSGGVEDVNTLSEADVEFLVDRQGKEITVQAQDQGDSGEIRYNRGHPVFATRRDTTSIGNYEVQKEQIMGESIETKEIAQNLANALVRKFSEPLLVGDATIAGIIGLKAGETVDVKVPSQDIDDTLTIEEVEYDYSSDSFTQTVELNEKLGDIESTVRNHEQRIKNLEGNVSGSLSIVPKFVFPSETVGVTESGTIETRSINDSFFLDRNFLGDHHYFSTQQDTDTEKGWDRGSYTGDATTSNQIGGAHTPSDVDASQYCSATAPSSGYEWIERIVIRDSNGNVLVDNTSGQNGGYLDATDKIAEADPGEQLEIEWHIGGSGGYTEYLSWNSDFDNPGTLSKEADLHSEVQPFTFTHTITAPSSEGDYMIRLQCNYSSFASGPCSMGSYGEYEDYTVSVTAQAPNPSGTESLTLGSFNSTGTWLVNLPFHPVDGSNTWQEITWSETEPSGTSAKINVLDTNGNYLAQDISSGTDLSTITGTDKQDLQIEIELTSDSDSVPEIDDLEVSFKPARLGDQSSGWNTEATF